MKIQPHKKKWKTPLLLPLNVAALRKGRLQTINSHRHWPAQAS